MDYSIERKRLKAATDATGNRDLRDQVALREYYYCWRGTNESYPY